MECFFDLSVTPHTAPPSTDLRRFPSGAALARHVRALLSRDTVDAETAALLRELALCHPRGPRTPSTFEIRVHRRAGRAPQRLVFGDGAPLPWRACIQAAFGGNAQKTLFKRRVNSVFRREVHDEVEAFRRAHQTSAEQDVDHVVPLKSLVETFLSTALGRPIYATDLTRENTLRDRALARRWRSFHQRHGRLQMLARKENQKKGARRDTP